MKPTRGHSRHRGNGALPSCFDAHLVITDDVRASRGPVLFGSRSIAQVHNRRGPAELGLGVQHVGGPHPQRGGARRNWHTIVLAGSVLELQHLTPSALPTHCEWGQLNIVRTHRLPAITFANDRRTLARLRRLIRRPITDLDASNRGLVRSLTHSLSVANRIEGDALRQTLELRADVHDLYRLAQSAGWRVLRIDSATHTESIYVKLQHGIGETMFALKMRFSNHVPTNWSDSAAFFGEHPGAWGHLDDPAVERQILDYLWGSATAAISS